MAHLVIKERSVIVTFVLCCLVSEILQVFCSESDPNGIPPEIFGVFSLDQIAHVVINPSKNLTLLSREIIFEEFQ